MTTAVAEPEPTTTAPAKLEAPPPEPIQAISLILSKGSLDMAYPGLIMANGARMTGIEANLFFTFWGLDIITEKKLDHLHTASVGNPSMPLPTLLGGLPGMEALTSKLMKKRMDELDIPPVREMLEILGDSGARLYACRMAMDMFGLTEKDLVPQVDGVLTVMDFYDMAAGSQIIFI
ncbi:MAG: DsrE/DsrF/DrsH-like family protein [Thermoanaerobaculia bacterium]